MNIILFAQIVDILIVRNRNKKHGYKYYTNHYFFPYELPALIYATVVERDRGGREENHKNKE
jgi:hypothetical protein